MIPPVAFWLDKPRLQVRPFALVGGCHEPFSRGLRSPGGRRDCWSRSEPGGGARAELCDRGKQPPHPHEPVTGPPAHGVQRHQAGCDHLAARSVDGRLCPAPLSLRPHRGAHGSDRARPCVLGADRQPSQPRGLQVRRPQRQPRRRAVGRAAPGQDQDRGQGRELALVPGGRQRPGPRALPGGAGVVLRRVRRNRSPGLRRLFQGHPRAQPRGLPRGHLRER